MTVQQGKRAYFKGLNGNGDVEFTKDFSCAQILSNKEIDEVYNTIDECLFDIARFDVVRV